MVRTDNTPSDYPGMPEAICFALFPHTVVRKEEMAISRNILRPLLEKAGIRRFSPCKALFSPLIVSRGAATDVGKSAPAGGIATDAINGGSAAIFEILENVEKGALSPTDAENKLRQFWKASSAVESSRSSVAPPPDETLKSFANLDHRRSLRAGFPEVREDFALPYCTYMYISINNINVLTCVVGYFFIRKDS